MSAFSKCDLLKILSWVFVASVLIQSLYTGLKYGCWWGLVVVSIGVTTGLIYARFRKCKAI